MKYVFYLLGVFLACGISFAEQPPSSLDLRDINGHSYMGPVRDQGGCGSCYSFGALAAAESAYNRHHGFYDVAAVKNLHIKYETNLCWPTPLELRRAEER